MKKIAIALAFAAASLVSTAANAQAYVSGHLGMGQIDLDCSGTTCDKSNVAFKLLGGYQFSNGLAAELGYASFGKLKWNDAFDSGNVTVGGILIGGAYHADLGNNFGLTARLGLASLKTKASVDGVGSASDTNTAPYFGISGTYALSKVVKLEAGLDFSRGDFQGEKADVRSLNIGARFSF